MGCRYSLVFNRLLLVSRNFWLRILRETFRLIRWAGEIFNFINLAFLSGLE